MWRSLGTFGCKLGLTCATWSDTPLKPKKMGNSGEQCRIESAKSSARAAPEGAHFEPKLEPIGHVVLKLGPHTSSWAPNWSHVTHMEIQVSNLGPFGGSFALPTETQGEEDCLRKHMKTPVRISPWPGLSPILKPRGPQLGHPSWAEVGPKLGRSWGLGRSWP